MPSAEKAEWHSFITAKRLPAAGRVGFFKKLNYDKKNSKYTIYQLSITIK
jgi:hypothetical protein